MKAHECYMVFTSSNFKWAKKSYSIPLLCDKDHKFVEPVCAYFRDRALRDVVAHSSLVLYADRILGFFRFLEGKRIDYMQVDDTILLEWLNVQAARGVGANTRAQRCDTIFDLYVWLEGKLYLNGSVKCSSREYSAEQQFCLSSRPVTIHKRRGRRNSDGIVSSLRPKTNGGKWQHTPTSEEVTKIYAAADRKANDDLTERDHLILDWFNLAGLRRFEILALTLSQIPSWDEIDSHRDLVEAMDVHLVVTKGGNERTVTVIPALLERTKDYIEGSRQNIVDRFSCKKDYRAPDEIFLSNKTGKCLEPGSLSNLGVQWFRDAKVKGRPHRLRAKNLLGLFESYIDAEEEKLRNDPEDKLRIDYEMILLKVAEHAGHTHINSLRPYLNYVRKRRLRASGGSRIAASNQEIEALRLENQRLQRRLAELEPGGE
ncbi:hypothetical protein [Pseudomonas coronafaciens]|uniref:hypothetical protein n=1 Tax=Pseudomonas coronafaciens TaxID=53409 RepID=UPI001424BB19|nr:hypothetical protein [Pseudomonas coronafaciens]QIQ72011.1 Tyrosine recombinase XerC [Pseudomonas coronafaciens]